MKRLLAGAVLSALLALPGLSRAETPGEPTHAADPAAVDAPAAQGEAGVPAEEDDLAARERAAPAQVAEFSGGADGVYITTGAIVVALLAVLLILAL